MRKQTKEKDSREWHDWFAWYPIWVSTGHCNGTWIFWERVQRKYRTSYGGVDIYIRNSDGSDLD